MSQLDDAISRYNKLLESGPCRDLGWVDDLQKRMEEEHLSAGGRLICPFLRPNFITRRQYETLVKTGESLISAIDRMQRGVNHAINLDSGCGVARRRGSPATLPKATWTAAHV